MPFLSSSQFFILIIPYPLQGIQLIVDDSGGFSNVAAQYLESIADDYTNTPVLLYCVRDPLSFGSRRNQRETIIRSLHDAVSFSKLSSFSNLVVPIGLPSLSMFPLLLMSFSSSIFNIFSIKKYLQYLNVIILNRTNLDL